VCRERKGRDVYIIGAANVGKSAFVRAMLRDMGKFDGDNFDPAAMANGRFLPVESAMPGTTLGIIPLQAFANGGTLYGGWALDAQDAHLHTYTDQSTSDLDPDGS
jgi:nitric-oxide synthase